MTPGVTALARNLVDSPEVLARFNEGLALVPVIARQVRRQVGQLELDELVACGYEGLIGAARRYDANRGVPFRAWAVLRVRGAMLDAVRGAGVMSRSAYKQIRAIEAADTTACTLLENSLRPENATIADERLTAHLMSMATAMATGYVAASSEQGLVDIEDTGDSPEEQLAREELVAAIRECIAALPEIERRLIERHYFDDTTLEEAGEELGLSKSWASRLHTRAIETIAKRLKILGRV